MWNRWAIRSRSGGVGAAVVGEAVGESDGAPVGAAVGTRVGALVAIVMGAAVGTTVKIGAVSSSAVDAANERCKRASVWLIERIIASVFASTSLVLVLLRSWYLCCTRWNRLRSLAVSAPVLCPRGLVGTAVGAKLTEGVGRAVGAVVAARMW